MLRETSPLTIQYCQQGARAEAVIPLLAEEGWREPDRAKPQLKTGKPSISAGLTTPSAPLRWLRGIFLVAQPPLLCEEGNAASHASSPTNKSA